MKKEQKSDIKKLSKLKLYPFSTEQYIRAKLAKHQSVKEFDLEVNSFENLELVFRLISTFLKEQKELNKLAITLNCRTNVLLDKTLYLLKDITTVNELYLYFQDIRQCSINSSLSLSQCFYSYQNLVSLHLFIDSEYLYKQDQRFRLYELYQRNPQLRKLKIELANLHEKSRIYYEIFEGISLLKQLESFDGSFYFLQHKCSKTLECLKDELQYQFFLKELRLFFGDKCFIAPYDFKIIDQILKRQINLENLSITAQCSNQQPEVSEIKFEKSLLALSKLKILSLQFDPEQSIEIKSIIHTISQMKQLEKVSLRAYIKEEEKNILRIGQSLMKIQNLFSLELNIMVEVEFNQLILLIALFHSLQNLKELRILSSFVQYQDYRRQYDKSKLFTTLSRLRVLKLIIFIKDIVQDMEKIVLDAIISAEELEEIVLQINQEYNKKKYVHNHNSLVKLIDNKTKLQHLKISYPRYQSEYNQSCDIIEKLGQNPNLEVIDISFQNEIKNSFYLLSQLSISLASLETLKILNITFGSEFHFDDSGFNLLADAFKQKQNLNLLKIDINIDDLQMKTVNNFTSALQYLKKLESLELSITGNEFQFEATQTKFANSFFLPSKLKSLNLKLYIKRLKFKRIEHIVELKIKRGK